MEKGDMAFDFKNDNAIVFGESVKSITTKLGQYTVPKSPYKTVLNNLTTGINNNITGDSWKDNDELKSLIKKVSDKCQICQRYRNVLQWI